MNFIGWIPWLLGTAGAVGGILNIFKDVTCFYIWSVQSVGWIWYILYFKQKNIYGQIIMWLTFTALNIWGIVEWSK